jgi:hypothetical protein
MHSTSQKPIDGTYSTNSKIDKAVFSSLSDTLPIRWRHALVPSFYFSPCCHVYFLPLLVFPFFPELFSLLVLFLLLLVPFPFSLLAEFFPHRLQAGFHFLTQENDGALSSNSSNQHSKAESMILVFQKAGSLMFSGSGVLSICASSSEGFFSRLLGW